MFGMPDLGFEDGIVEYMVIAENWPTRTEFYDAEIWSTFYLKVGRGWPPARRGGAARRSRGTLSGGECP